MALPITWLACDFRTGYIACELPSLTPTGPLSRRLGTYTTTSFSLVLAGAAAGWTEATDNGRTLLVAVLDGAPVWAGTCTVRGDRGSAPAVTLTATTAEGYLNRRFVPTVAFTGTDLSDIGAGLLAGVLADTPVLDVTVTPAGVTADQSYQASADHSVAAALGDLMALEGGPEWTVDPVWNTDRSGVRLVVRIGPRIGQQAGPPPVFDFPGAVTAYAQQESYEDGKSATVVQATGAGDGPTRAVSDIITSPLIAQGWPVYEYRWSPGTDITNTTVLTSYARSAADVMQAGASAWSVTAAVAEAPRLGEDWSLGSAVRLLVAPGTAPGHPAGADITARAWAWELDTAAETVSPILLQE